MLKKEEIRIRDPYVFTDFENKCYYLTGSINLPNSYKTTHNFYVFKTRDLEHFDEPKVIFDARKTDFWADRDFWAPELHFWNGKYYLFASFKAEGKCRACQVLVSDTPDGEYKPLSDKPITPLDWECLDGTLYVENGTPYMIFCHEWVQIKNGEICAVELSSDLSRAVGEPFTLFRASDNPDVSEHVEGSGNYVTDGPFVFCEKGKVKMIWSSFKCGKYAVFEAEADSLKGKWTHKPSRFNFDCGHAMIFKTLDGQRKIALHSPNKTNYERFVYYEF